MSHVSAEEADVAAAEVEKARAESALRRAFVAALDAENAGADVSALMDKLTAAGKILVDATVALDEGNYTFAINRADLCTATADSAMNDADALKTSAVASTSGMWMTVSFTIVGAAVFLIMLYLVWRRFSQHYERRLLERKLEVAA